MPRAQGIRAGFLEVESAPPTYTLKSPSTPCQKHGVLWATNKYDPKHQGRIYLKFNIN